MFNNITTMDELKKAYRAAAMHAHPDHGGSTEQMQQVNAAYEKRFEEIKAGINAQAAADPTGKTRTVNEMPAEFIAVISKLLSIPDIIIELCGSWVWVSGETREHKDEIKAAGCFWAKKKGMWYWRCAKDAHHGKSHASMADIRRKYGSERITSDGHRADALPA
jgi:curved DNA-binding protein CbpA